LSNFSYYFSVSALSSYYWHFSRLPYL